MTPQEQIAYLRADVEHAFTQDRRTMALAAVCDLAERALVLIEAADAMAPHIPDFIFEYAGDDAPVVAIECSCDWRYEGDTPECEKEWWAHLLSVLVTA